jgi:hypothetical protein
MTFDELALAIGEGAPMPVTHRSPVRRHRSLESLVAWSAELLDPSLRRTFTEFAVFAGSVAAADAAAVVGADRAGVIFDLAALAERSLLVADVGESATRYRMLATVRSVAGRWLEESSSAGDVRRRHAEHFTDATRLIDAQIRTADEARGRRRLDEIVAEVRAAHRWARRHHPSLASAMSGALHFAAYSTFWNEPTEWSRSLLADPVGGAGALSGLASWLPVRMRTTGSSPTPDQLQRCRSRPRMRCCPGDLVRRGALRRQLGGRSHHRSFGGWVSARQTGMRS